MTRVARFHYKLNGSILKKTKKLSLFVNCSVKVFLQIVISPNIYDRINQNKQKPGENLQHPLPTNPRKPLKTQLLIVNY